MGFFSTKKKIKNKIIIHIGTDSVGGACISYPEQDIPTIHYLTRIAIQQRDSESLEMSMLRALEDVGALLVRDGSPQLLKETGTGSVESVCVSLSYPWEETTVHTHILEHPETFVFTKEVVHEIITSNTQIQDNRTWGENTVIATRLNGYQTENPFGRSAKRAEVTLLSTHFEKTVVEGITSKMRSLYHGSEVTCVPYSATSFTALHLLYPHEKNFLIVTITKEGTYSILVTHGIYTDIVHIQKGSTSLQNDELALWIQEMKSALEKISQSHILPNTIFSIATEEIQNLFKTHIQQIPLSSLWLSGTPSTILPVEITQVKEQIHNNTDENDIFLVLLAISQK
jgi:hypothetical protein